MVNWVKRAAREGSQHLEWQSEGIHGRRFWLDVLLSTVVIDGEERVLSVATDITTRKLTEEELRRNHDELSRFNLASIGRELDMIELKKQVNALSGELGRTPPYSLAFLDAEEEQSPKGNDRP
jgi:PAS domain-containing protein